VPPFLAEPILAKASPPSRRMKGSMDSVSTLLTTVGLAMRPATVGKGGGWRGQAFLPSMVSSKAVSRPEM
jgi:hypothetical protein